MGIANKDRATFSIDPAVKQTLEEQIPKSRRSAFVEDAIAEALRRNAAARLDRTLDRIAGSTSSSESSVELLRQIRDERARYLIDRHDVKHG